MSIHTQQIEALARAVSRAHDQVSYGIKAARSHDLQQSKKWFKGAKDSINMATGLIDKMTKLEKKLGAGYYQ
jgi:hypothetical protein